MANTFNLNAIKEAISKVTGLTAEEIDNDASLMQDIGLSSLELTAILSDLETMYHVSLSTKDLRKVITLNDLAGLVSECLSGVSNQ